MKSIFFLLLLISILFFQANSTLAQSATTMQDILETVTEKTLYLEDTKDQEIVNISIDLLVRSGEKVLYRYLDPSFDYYVVAYGDRRISSLTLSVNRKHDGEWEFVTEKTDSSLQIMLLPSSNDQYEFIITVDKFVEDEMAGHYAIMIYHKDPLKE